MRPMMRAAVALGVAIGGLSNAGAQSWPTRQVTLVVPYGPEQPATSLRGLSHRVWRKFSASR